MKQYFSVLLPFMAACVFAVSCSSGSEGDGTSNPKNPLEEDITEVQTPAPLAAEPYSPSKLGLSYKPIMVKYSSLKPSVDWNTANESKTRIMNNMVGFTPETDYQKYKNSVNKYGGSTVLPRQTATGRFYTKKINGRWWIVDPEGCLNVHRGLASFRTSETTAGKAALATKYGSEDTWI